MRIGKKVVVGLGVVVIGAIAVWAGLVLAVIPLPIPQFCVVPSGGIEMHDFNPPQEENE